MEFVQSYEILFYLAVVILAIPLLIYLAYKRSKDKDKEKFEKRDF